MKKIDTNMKSFKIGSYSAVITAVVIAVIIALNLFAGQLPSKYALLDLTGDELLTFSEETEKYAREQVTEEVTLYHICKEGSEEPYVEEILSRFSQTNDKIKVEKIDPVKNPTFTKKYTDLSLADNSVIAVSAKRNCVVTAGEFYQYEPTDYPGQFISQSTYEQYSQYYAMYGQSFTANPYFFGEKQIVGAIDYVITDELPVVYATTNHGETAFGSAYKVYTEDENVELKEVNLVSGDSVIIPTDAEAVFINCPQTDITEAEYDALVKYLEDGGNLILTTDYTYYTAEKMPNLIRLTAFMGLKGTEDLIGETSTSNYYQSPYMLIPVVEANGVVADFAKTSTAFYCYNAHPITKAEAENRTVTPLFKSSDKALLFSQYEASESLEDIELAEYTYAYQSTIADSESGKTAGTLVWIGSGSFFADEMMNYTTSNLMLYTTMLTDMCDKPISINVSAKPITSAVLEITETDFLVGFAAYVIIIPLAFLVAGFTVWFIRRRK